MAPASNTKARAPGGAQLLLETRRRSTMLLRGAVRYPLSRRQSTMGFGAVVGLLVGAGSQPSPRSPQWGWGVAQRQGAGGGWLVPRGYRSRWLSPERCECHLHATVLEETIAKKGRCWQRIRRYGPARSSPGCREGAGCCCHGELGLVSMPDRGVGIPRVSWWCHRPGAGGRGRVGEQRVPKQCHPAAAGRDPHSRRGRGGQEGARSLTGL